MKARDFSAASALSALRARRLKGAFDYAQHRFPNVYCKLRNKMALLRWYSILYAGKFSRQESYDAYDSDFWQFHNTGDWNGFARVVLSRFVARSILDVGCGQGNALKGFRNVDPQLKLKGLERSGAALTIARSKGLDILHADLAALNKSTAEKLLSAIGGADVALCLEVAEHMPISRSNKLLRFLTGFDTVIFSAAHPNQGGVLHVNEQPAKRWIRKFNNLGFRLAGDNEAFRREIGKLDLPGWYAENVNVFKRLG
jgi:SAM-dependent methyltransferase